MVPAESTVTHSAPGKAEYQGQQCQGRSGTRSPRTFPRAHITTASAKVQVLPQEHDVLRPQK